MNKKLELQEVELEEFKEAVPYAILVERRNKKPKIVEFDKEDFLSLIEEKNSNLIYDTLIWLDEKGNSIVVPYEHMLFEN